MILSNSIFHNQRQYIRLEEYPSPPQFENVLPHFRLFTALVATRELRNVKKLWTKSLRVPVTATWNNSIDIGHAQLGSLSEVNPLFRLI